MRVTSRKIALDAAIALIALTVLFPPWKQFDGGPLHDWGPFWKPWRVKGNETKPMIIDKSMLATEWLGITILTGIAYVRARLVDQAKAAEQRH